MTMQADRESRPVGPFIRFALRDEDLASSASVGPGAVARRVSALRFRLLAGTGLPPADPVKAWDATNVVDLVSGLSRRADVLDCGAFNSMALYALADAGFTRLQGIDLNPRVLVQPFCRRISYSVQDMQRTAYDDAEFDVVVSASTVEHGVSWDRFLAEARRLLRPGGRLYVSTDLINDGVDTSTLRAFGLPWNPIRPSELPNICRLFRRSGYLTADLPSITVPADLPCSFLGVRHGFAAFHVMAV